MVIEVFQDTVCPWCRIGKKNLYDAISKWDGEEITVKTRTFFLNEQTPVEGVPFRKYMASIKGESQIEGLFDYVKQAGNRIGMNFDFSKIEVSPNTILSHQLIFLTPENQKLKMVDALHDAFFEGGINIGDINELVKIAEQQGLDGKKIKTQLLNSEGKNEILAESEWAKRNGIRGVPFFIIGQYGLSGAQPPDVILKAMKMASESAEKEKTPQS